MRSIRRQTISLSRPPFNMYYNFNQLQYFYYFMQPPPLVASSVPSFAQQPSLVERYAQHPKHRHNEIQSKSDHKAKTIQKNFIQKIYEIKTVQPIAFNTLAKDGKDHLPVFTVALKLNQNSNSSEFLGTGEFPLISCCIWFNLQILLFFY